MSDKVSISRGTPESVDWRHCIHGSTSVYLHMRAVPSVAQYVLSNACESARVPRAFCTRIWTSKPKRVVSSLLALVCQVTCEWYCSTIWHLHVAMIIDRCLINGNCISAHICTYMMLHFPNQQVISVSVPVQLRLEQHLSVGAIPFQFTRTLSSTSVTVSTYIFFLPSYHKLWLLINYM